jgi:hypothetical protein
MKKIELPFPSLICGLFLFAVSAPSALADAELQILVGSTLVYDSGDLASVSGSGAYSYSAGTTSFSLQYGWNNEGPGGGGHLMSLTGLGLTSTVPVTIELSENDNTVEHSCWTQATVGFNEQYVGSFSTYVDENNVLLAPTELLFTIPPSWTRANEGEDRAGAFFDTSGPYSLTQVLTLTGGPGPDGILTVNTNVPDGGMTLSMLGISLFGLFAFRNRLLFGKCSRGHPRFVFA